MEQSTGREPTQIEIEAMRAICNLQDENRELKLEVQRLKADASMLDWIEKQIGGRVSLWPLVVNDIMNGKRIRAAIKRAGFNPSPTSHSQTEGNEK